MRTNSSFVNGVITGTGITLAVMSIAFLQMTAPLEGKMGFSTTEIRVSIFLGFIVCVVAVLYEFYRKKIDDHSTTNDTFTKSSDLTDTT